MAIFIGSGGQLGDVLAAIWLVVTVLVIFAFRHPRIQLGGNWQFKAPSASESRSRESSGLLARAILLLVLLLGTLVVYLLRTHP